MKLKTINFERTTGKALYLQIYEKLRSDILSGYLVKVTSCLAYGNARL